MPGPPAGAAIARRIWTLPLRQAIVAVAERVVTINPLRVSGTYYRTMPARYLDRGPPEPLYYRGSLRGRRFTPVGGPAGLYLSCDPATPMAEVRAVFFRDGAVSGVSEHDPLVTISAHVETQRVLDIVDARVRRALDLSRAEIVGDWYEAQERYLAGLGPMPPTQLLALVTHATKTLTGIRYPSAQTEFGFNLVVFPDRLLTQYGEAVEVIDSTGRYHQRLPK